MTEKDIQIFDECLTAIKYINLKMGTNYKLEQNSSNFTKLLLRENKKLIFKGSLKDCDKLIAGMLVTAISKDNLFKPLDCTH